MNKRTVSIETATTNVALHPRPPQQQPSDDSAPGTRPTTAESSDRRRRVAVAALPRPPPLWTAAAAQSLGPRRPRPLTPSRWRRPKRARPPCRRQRHDRVDVMDDGRRAARRSARETHGAFQMHTLRSGVKRRRRRRRSATRTTTTTTELCTQFGVIWRNLARKCCGRTCGQTVVW